jgi:hypothetical protein
MLGSKRPRRTARRGALVALAGFIFFHAAPALAGAPTETFWHDVQARSLPGDAPQAAAYRALTLDAAAMAAALAEVRANGAASVALPRPDGGFAEFQVVDSRTMPKALQDKYPEIVSLAGSDGAGRKVRIDSSPLGFQAMVFEADGLWVVRPETFGGDRYMSFRRADLPVPGRGFRCDAHDGGPDPAGKGLLGTPAPATLTGAVHREYRAAVAANHNYVAAVGGGTVAGGLAAVVTAMNRVNEVYETDLAVHLTLIPNNDAIIYADSASDPYSNGTGALNQNQANLDSVIGTANYDIGHVFTTGSGGVAGLRVTCREGQKARGTTGMPNPIGDAYYIDYVAHEMGHQFGGNHTFNSTSSSCGGGNRASSAAYEPGSGTTIMAYAGICGADNVQPHSDPYFHAKSLEEINTWIEGNGGTCAAQTPNASQAPVIDAASLPNGFTIPARTPFALTGVAVDADGDSLSYSWEQYDLGSPSTLAQGDIGNGPIFRSFNASADGTRYFPRLSTILGGAPARGEALPTTTRDLKFRLTVRDNRAVGGRSQSADIQLHVVNTAGPFAVTRPNTDIAWGRGETHAVTWDVAGTNVAPVGCSAVDIDLSTDGGQTFDHVLLTGAPNSGSAQVTVPAVADTNQARVRVNCADNVFLDISDANFRIAAVGDPDPLADPQAQVTPPALAFAVDYGASASDAITVANTGGPGTSLAYTVTASAGSCAAPAPVGWLGVADASGSVAAGASATVAVSVDASGLAPGVQSATLCVASNDPAQATIEIPVALEVAAPANDAIFADGFEGTPAQTCTPQQLFADPGFEATDAGTGENPSWTGTDSLSGTPFCDASCDDGSTIVAHAGDWFVWFGGYDQANEASLSQAVVFPSGQPRWLNFWMINMIAPDPTATLKLSIDGQAVSTIAPATDDAAYTARSLEVPAAYLDGQSHTVRFDWSAQAADGEVGGAMLDDLTLDCAAQPPAQAPASPLHGPTLARRRSH